MELGSRFAFAVVLLVGVAGTGLVVRVLNSAGFSGIGVAVWIAGYGTMIGVLWYGWVRPLDLTGPTESEGDSGSDTTSQDPSGRD